MEHKELALVAIIAIVGIVAIIMLVTNGQNIRESSGNIAGQAPGGICPGYCRNYGDNGSGDVIQCETGCGNCACPGHTGDPCVCFFGGSSPLIMKNPWDPYMRVLQ